MKLDMTQIDLPTKLSNIVFSIIMPLKSVDIPDKNSELAIYKFTIQKLESNLISKNNIEPPFLVPSKLNTNNLEIDNYCKNTFHISLIDMDSISYPNQIKKIIEKNKSIELQELIDFINPNSIEYPSNSKPETPTQVIDLATSLIESLLNVNTETLKNILDVTKKSNIPLQSLVTSLMLEKDDGLLNDNHQLDSQTFMLEEDFQIESTKINITEKITSIFSPNGHLSNNILDYEARPEQINMSENILNSLIKSENLIIEAGTGTGKSIAYLIPAFLNSIKTNSTTVISTNTINLQEQLLKDDIPLTIQCLQASGVTQQDIPRFSILKGKSNYLCIRRLQNMLQREMFTKEECFFLLKLLIWVEKTETGDKSELSFNDISQKILWEQISEEGSAICRLPNEKCFFKKAKELANKSKIIITNHSLLMADINSEGSTLPTYDNLIIDEAHHLEEQATKSLGFEISTSSINEILEKTDASDSSIENSIKILRTIVKNSESQLLDSTLTEIKSTVNQIKKSSRELFNFRISEENTDDNAIKPRQIRITELIRNQNWSQIEEITENVLLQFNTLTNLISQISRMLESKTNQSILMNFYNDLNSLKSDYYAISENLNEFIFEPNSNSVYWLERDLKSTKLSFSMAPIEVDHILNMNLFSEKNSVILTSATLAINESFDHIKARLGLEFDNSYIYLSPFKYETSTLMLTPEYIPDPRDEGYLEYVCKSIEMASIGAEGRALALFTSYSSIQSVYEKLEGSLRKHKIDILAQGVSGSPQQLVNHLRKNSRTLLLGTSSMWEGIDLRGNALQVLIMARLPFGVPTDPIYEARSEKYDNPFIEFAVPNAILKFKQGFGRLIRSNKDKGIFILLDNRVKSKKYGQVFIKALPQMCQEEYANSKLSRTIKKWLT